MITAVNLLNVDSAALTGLEFALCSKIYELLVDLFKDELSHLWLKVLKNLLNYMISLWVLRKLHDVSLQSTDNQLKLLWHVDCVKH